MASKVRWYGRRVFRLGCFGCLAVLVLVSMVGLFGLGLLQISRAPDFVDAPTSAADGQRAQQKIFDVLRRAGNGRPHLVALSEQEVNAFLARHLGQTGALPLRRLAVRLPRDGHAEIAGQIPLRQLIGVAPLSALAGVLPSNLLDRGVWVAVRARVTLENSEPGRESRHLRLDVERFWLGRLRLPEIMLRVLLDPGALRLLRWPMPESIDGLRIESGKLVVQSAS